MTKLKAALARADKDDFGIGLNAGMKWAEGIDSTREARALRCLSLDRSTHYGETWLKENQHDLPEDDHAGVVFYAMFRESQGREECNEFWEKVAGTENPMPEFLRGFCVGALRVYCAALEVPSSTGRM